MSSFKLRKEKNCLNCGHQVDKHFCPECGQENIEVKEDAVHMVMHAIADYFHFEHKFFGTIKPLLIKPGTLTKAYVEGKRVRFIHPIRLYIFVSIVFFLVILSGNGKKKEETAKGPSKPLTSKDIELKNRETLIGIKEAMKYIPGDQKKKDSIIKVAEEDLKKDGTTDINLYTGDKTPAKNWKSKLLPKDSTVAGYEKSQAALPSKKRDGFIKHYITKRTIELNKYPDPKQKFVEDLLHNIPKMMFLLLPLFALILKLVYINKNRYYYEHLIYSFHTHAAIFLAILVTMLLQWLTGLMFDISSWLSFACFIYIVWHIYRSLRTFYGSTRWVTALKMFFLFFCYNIVGTLCFLLILAVSFVMI